MILYYVRACLNEDKTSGNGMQLSAGLTLPAVDGQAARCRIVRQFAYSLRAQIVDC